MNSTVWNLYKDSLISEHLTQLLKEAEGSGLGLEGMEAIPEQLNLSSLASLEGLREALADTRRMLPRAEYMQQIGKRPRLSLQPVRCWLPPSCGDQEEKDEEEKEEGESDDTMTARLWLLSSGLPLNDDSSLSMAGADAEQHLDLHSTANPTTLFRGGIMTTSIASLLPAAELLPHPSRAPLCSASRGQHLLRLVCGEHSSPLLRFICCCDPNAGYGLGLGLGLGRDECLHLPLSINLGLGLGGEEECLVAAVRERLVLPCTAEQEQPGPPPSTGRSPAPESQQSLKSFLRIAFTPQALALVRAQAEAKAKAKEKTEAEAAAHAPASLPPPPPPPPPQPQPGSQR